MTDKSAFPAPEGDAEDGEIIPRIEETVNSKSSISEENSSDKLYSIDDSAEVSGSEAADNQAALEKFGTTTDFEQAGFAMADGRMLKLSQYGQRGVQHRVIEGIYEDTKGDEGHTSENSRSGASGVRY